MFDNANELNIHGHDPSAKHHNLCHGILKFGSVFCVKRMISKLV